MSIKPIRYKGAGPEKPVLGAEYFKTLYPNVFLCAKKKSGKTTVLYNIMRNCVDKRAKVYIFASTVYKDKAYKAIAEMLKARHIETGLYQDFILEDGSNILEAILADEGRPEEIDDEEEKLEPAVCRFDKVGCEKKLAKPKAYKTDAPELVFVFDDLGTHLRHQSIAKLLKKNRHYKSMVLMSSQWPNDIEPAAWRNLDYALIFRGFAEDKVKRIHELMDVSTELEEFDNFYADNTQEKYSFITIGDDELRIKFKNAT